MKDTTGRKGSLAGTRLKAIVLVFGILVSGWSCSTMKQSDRAECPSVKDGDCYFPADIDTFERDWYSKHLRAMNEPSLSCGQRTAEFTYRFLWLRTFHHPICVRIEKEGSSAVLYAVELDGAGGYEPGKPLRQIHRTLSADEEARLVAGLGKIWYWGTPRYMAVGGLDGAQWILEGAQDGQYQIMKEWSPRMGTHYDVCLLFLELAGFSIPPKEIY